MSPEQVVVDTNVFISAALTDGLARQAIVKVLKHFTILQSVPTYEELRSRIYKKKFDKYLSERERLDFLTVIQQNSVIIETSLKITDCRDPDDNKFLEIAIKAQAKYLITGDDDLLALRVEPPYQKLIITPVEFLQSG
ncbi:MAG: putative toxin-antitoxin system toxin component, PIN family [Cyanobacteria bacterium RI_101]|nr:putative toxin-antitoxin system toxin component, PIN family [Cyanobacteria bacterium RI_101]